MDVLNFSDLHGIGGVSLYFAIGGFTQHHNMKRNLLINIGLLLVSGLGLCAEPTISGVGENPTTKLIASSDGFIYGVNTTGGASGNGAVFCINPNTQQTTLIYSFPTSAPSGRMIEASDGTFYQVPHWQ